MKSCKVPVLLWTNDSGLCTGLVAETGLSSPDISAVGDSRRSVLDQLKSCMEWHYRVNASDTQPDMQDAELQHMRIQIRPRYFTHGQEFPCTELLEFSIPWVRAKRENGIFVCTVPMLGLTVQQVRDNVLTQIVREGVHRHLSDWSPGGLRSLLALQDVSLDQVIVRVRHRPARQLRSPEPDLASLKTVGRPMGAPEFRKRFLPAWKRESAVNDLGERLTGDSSILMVGDRSVGKSTLLVAAVRNAERRIQENADDNSDSVARYRHIFWHSSAARLVAGMQYLGEWQQRCEEVIDDLREIRGTLYIENLTDLLTKGGSAAEDSIAAYMMSFMQTGDLRLLAEVTPSELTTCRRLLPGFVEMFDLYQVEPLSSDDATSALRELAEQKVRDTKVNIDAVALDQVGRLHRRFHPYQPLPGPAAEFLIRTFADFQQKKQASIDAGDVISRFARDSGLPEELLRDDVTMTVSDVRETLSAAVMGQDDAVATVAGYIASFKVGLNDPNRPLATLLFAGPTGVGKTELAKAATDYLFGSGDNKDRLLRFDMSEYSSFLSAQRLLNESDGSTGRLISRIRQQPFQIVLFDEIEKASPDVFDLLLGLFDEGRLTDRYGRTANFCTSMIIMTSNLGASTRSVGFGGHSSVTSDNRPEQYFRPEFFNRIDTVVNFTPLSEETCRSIVRKELRALSKRDGLIKRSITLTFADEVVDFLLEKGFDAAFGARPLQRMIEQHVVGPLSRFLVDNEPKPSTVLHCEHSGDLLKFESDGI